MEPGRIKKPTQKLLKKPKWEGHLDNPEAAMKLALRDIENDPQTWVFTEAINEAYRQFQEYHDALIHHRTSGKSTQDTLKDFDDEVQRIKDIGYGKRMNRIRNRPVGYSQKVIRDQRSKAAAQIQDEAEKDKNEDESGKLGKEAKDRCGAGDDSENRDRNNGRTQGSGRKENITERQYPNECHPQNVWLEFAPKKTDRNKMGVAWKDSDDSELSSTIKTGQRSLNAPGWLNDLTSAQIKEIYNIKYYLTRFERTDDVTQAVDTLYEFVESLGLAEVTKPEITKVIRWIPIGKKTGLDYRAFLLALGDFNYATERQALKPYPRKLKFRDDLNDEHLYCSAETDPDVEAIFGELNEYESFFRIKKIPPLAKFEEEPPPFPIRDPQEYVPTIERQAMFDWRKRVIKTREKQIKIEFEWTKKLLDERKEAFNKQREIYNRQLAERKSKEAEEKRLKEDKKKKFDETKQRILAKYIEEGVLPKTAEKKAQAYMIRQTENSIQMDKFRDTNTYTTRQQILWTGLFFSEMYEAIDTIRALAEDTNAIIPHKVGPRNVDLNKAWQEDMMEKRAAANSPYLEPVAFVNNRLHKHYRHGCSSGPTDFENKVAFDHWIIDIPPSGEGQVMMTENRFRIKQILDYVFFKEGSALCLLPRVDLLLHFTQNLTDQLLGRTNETQIPSPSLLNRKVGGSDGDGASLNSKNSKLPPEGSGRQRQLDKNEKPYTKRPKSASFDISSIRSQTGEMTWAKSDENKSVSTIRPKSAPTIPFKQFHNPERDLPQVECHPKPLLPIREICVNGKPYPPRLPEKFQGSEYSWIHKFTSKLPRHTIPADFHTDNGKLPFEKVQMFREAMTKFHATKWDAYNCRRYQFRKALWKNMKIQDYQNAKQRNIFATTFWTLLPHDNRIPRSLLNTNVERALLMR